MKTKGKYRVLDLFCGTGALSYGVSASDSSFVTVAGIDLDQSASRTAAANHPFARIVCDRIENVTPEDLVGSSGVDVVVGGPPCQGFSSLRPSRGQDLEDPRNRLYKQFIRYVSVLRPSVVLMENVVGLVNAGEGQLLQEILRGFRATGYYVEWRILNAANFGVPQKRERFFLVGVKASSGLRSPIDFPTPTHKFVGRVIGTRHKSNCVVNTNRGIPALTVWDAISDLPSLASGEKSDKYRRKPSNGYQEARRRGAMPRLTLHEAANHSPKMLRVIHHSGSSMSSLPVGLVTSGYSSCYSRLERAAPATTITVKFTSPASSKCIHPVDNRAITPREAARIQGFDDRFQFCGSKTDIACQIGNAVPPLLGGAFADVLRRVLDGRRAVEEV